MPAVPAGGLAAPSGPATGAANAAIDWHFTVGDRVKIRLVNDAGRRAGPPAGNT